MEEPVRNYIYDDFIESQIGYEFGTFKDIKIRTIIFDFGGVLFTDGTWAAIKKLINTLHLNENQCEILEECFSNKSGSLAQLIRMGLITLDEFLNKIIIKLGLPDSKKKLIKHIWFSSYVPNYKMKKILKQLSKKYKLVAFSGNVKERIKYIQKRYDFLKYFDDMIFSFDYKRSKKELELYHELLNHIDCEPSEAILIDNSWGNINRAKKVGLNGIFYSYTKQLFENLKEFEVRLNL
jgi:HAD superfamily hydrolase (TIGR01509 family)